MNDNTYITFKFYDETGRRLGIFGEYFPENSRIEIAVFPCSKRDFFSKKAARAAYEKLLISVAACNEAGFHPTIDSVEVYEKTPRKAFLDFCFDNYCRKLVIVSKLPVVRTILRSKDEIISRKDELDYSILNKMDYA